MKFNIHLKVKTEDGAVWITDKYSPYENEASLEDLLKDYVEEFSNQILEIIGLKIEQIEQIEEIEDDNSQS